MLCAQRSPVLLVVLTALLPSLACVEERSRSRPSSVVLTPEDDTLPEIEWRFDYDEGRVTSIERREDGDFVIERRFDYDADGYVKEVTIEDRDGEYPLDVTTVEGIVTRVAGDVQRTVGNTDQTLDIAYELEIDDDGRPSRLITTSFFEAVDDSIPFLVSRSKATADEELEFEIDDEGRIAALVGDRVNVNETALGDLVSTTTTTTDVNVELRYGDDGLSRVTREEESTTGNATSESSIDLRISYADQRISELEESFSAGDVTKDWELTVDDQGRVTEMANDDERIEIAYDDEPLTGPTIAMPRVSFGEYLDLAGKAFTSDYRLDHLALP